jgi:hypothetical protein
MGYSKFYYALLERVGARDGRTQFARACLFFFFTSNPSPKKLKNLKPNTFPFFSASLYPIFLIISWVFSSSPIGWYYAKIQR